MKPTRPLVRYHGGKWKLAPWIIGHFPEHRVYVEPYGGGGSVLIRKPRCYAEIYNDLDREIVNLFQVARDRGPELKRALELTPFAREEFELSYKSADDPIEQARRSLTRAYMGFGSTAICGEVSGFRSNSNRSGTTPAHDWKNYPDCLTDVIERLRGVVIENRDAMAVMAHHDTPETLHYCDPPYVHSTRSEKMRGTVNRKAYKHEMTDDQHRQFGVFARGLVGMVIVSGYDCPMYAEMFGDWQQFRRQAHADGARDRVEVLWVNQKAKQRQMRLVA